MSIPEQKPSQGCSCFGLVLLAFLCWLIVAMIFEIAGFSNFL